MIVLQPHGNARASLVNGELTGQVTTRGHLLNKSDGAVILNGVVDKGIRLDGAFARTKCGRLQVEVSDGGCNEELVVALYPVLVNLNM